MFCRLVHPRIIIGSYIEVYAMLLFERLLMDEKEIALLVGRSMRWGTLNSSYPYDITTVNYTDFLFA